ncbi:MAG: hypothetical protein ACJA0U_000102 [Salibacteraceae bacterium]
MGFISAGAGVGYHIYKDSELNTFTFNPQIGANIKIGSIYYGYIFRTNSNPYATINIHNLTLSLFVFGWNDISRKKNREFKWWGNLFK